jgi:uncharacterized protein (TIGR00645 family)
MKNAVLKQPALWISLVEAIVFNVKWVLLLFYLGLVAVLLMFAFAYAKEVALLTTHAAAMSTEEMKIVALEFVDVVMVANLIKMIITGSYNSFVSKDHGRPNENISSGTLKIKISTSIIVVSAIYLLRNFVSNNSAWEEIRVKLLIFALFLATTLVLGILEYLHVKGQEIESTLKD